MKLLEKTLGIQIDNVHICMVFTVRRTAWSMEINDMRRTGDKQIIDMMQVHVQRYRLQEQYDRGE